MDLSVNLFTILLIAANVLFSMAGWRDRSFFERHLFDVGRIMAGGEYRRVFTSAFLHANTAHLLFNMIALYSFGYGVSAVLGTAGYALVYFGSLLAGSLLSLRLNRRNPSYRAVGASGAVSGVVFAHIVLFPDGAVSFLFLPVAIPSWLFGIGFVIVSTFGIRWGWGHVGHAAHLGGAIAGVVLLAIVEPRVLLVHPLVVAAILVPAVLFLLFASLKPGTVRIVSGEKRDPPAHNDVDERLLWREMNELLDRVGRLGMEGLSDAERKRLEELSRLLRNSSGRT